MGKAISSLGVCLLIKAKVKATSDTAKDANKVYYVLNSTTGVYMVASEAEVASAVLTDLYELDETGTLNWVQPICLTDVPDIGGDVEKIETTTLCDKQRTYINGILDAGESLDFTANYVHNVFLGLKALANKKMDIMVAFGGLALDTLNNLIGNQGSCTFEGYVSTKLNGFGVNEVIPMTLSITIASEMIFA